MAKRFYCILTILSISLYCSYSEELSPDAVGVDLNGYFDSFGVNVVYPTINVSKSIANKTSINARYLVDIITSASMRCHFDSVYSFVNAQKYGKIDAYTSATPKGQQPNDGFPPHGGGDSYPDEIRHEFGIGATQIIGETTLNFNNLFSIEHDYSSESITGNVNIPFAKKNTVLNLGIVKSWDKNYPQTRTWTASKDVLSLDGSLSQIFSTSFITQFDLSYSRNSGFLADPYQVIQVRLYDNSNNLLNYRLSECYLPDLRNRYAAGLRGVLRLWTNGSLQFGYRYYFDDWDIRSNTMNALLQMRTLSDKMILGFGGRIYFQTKSKYFMDYYATTDTNYFNYFVPGANTSLQNVDFMSVDNKLNKLNSYEIELNMALSGSALSFINTDRAVLNGRLNLYFKNLASPDWISRSDKMYAIIFSLGIRYLL